jgi:hypothetical protein
MKFIFYRLINGLGSAGVCADFTSVNPALRKLIITNKSGPPLTIQSGGEKRVLPNTQFHKKNYLIHIKLHWF